MNGIIKKVFSGWRFGILLFLTYIPLFIVKVVYQLPFWVYLILLAGMFANSLVNGWWYMGWLDDDE